MLNIVIVDDEAVQIKYLTLLINEWASISNTEVSIVAFNSGEAFLFNYSANSAADIILLDIQMIGIDGVSLARKIRETNNAVQLIFVTGYDGFMSQGYEVSALHYLLKPVDKQKLFETLNRAIVNLKAQQIVHTIVFPQSGGNIRIVANDILYAEMFSHTITLFLKSGTEDFNMRIADMEKLLGKDFFRCHRSYIVSMKHVLRVTKTAMMLDMQGNNPPLAVPLSRKLYDAANQAFIKYN